MGEDAARLLCHNPAARKVSGVVLYTPKGVTATDVWGPNLMQCVHTAGGKPDDESDPLYGYAVCARCSSFFCRKQNASNHRKHLQSKGCGGDARVAEKISHASRQLEEGTILAAFQGGMEENFIKSYVSWIACGKSQAPISSSDCEYFQGMIATAQSVKLNKNKSLAAIPAAKFTSTMESLYAEVVAFNKLWFRGKRLSVGMDIWTRDSSSSSFMAMTASIIG